MNTETRIVHAFKEMARHQGFYAIRMEDLATKAGITKKTIYAYFSSKQDLVEKVVNAFISDVEYEVKTLMSKSDIVDSIAATAKSFIKEGAFLFNVQSLQDLQIHYSKSWKQIEDFRKNMIDSLVEVIFVQTKQKWVLEIHPSVLKQSFLAINNRFSTPELALEIGISVEEMTYQMAKILIYPYL